MRRLRDFQQVLLQSGDEGFVCRVVALQEEEAILLPDDPTALALGRAPVPASISFTPDVHPVLITGFLDRGPLDGTARFFAVDRTTRPEPRRAARMPLEIPVVVKAVNAPMPVAARTLDISAVGLRLGGWTSAQDTAVTVLLTLPGADDRLQLEGVVVRSGPDTAAVALDDPDHRLAEFVLHCRRTLAERLVERDAA